jgi:hypothetical protein
LYYYKIIDWSFFFVFSLFLQLQFPQQLPRLLDQIHSVEAEVVVEEEWADYFHKFRYTYTLTTVGSNFYSLLFVREEPN